MSEQEVSLILSQMDPSRGLQQQQQQPQQQPAFPPHNHQQPHPQPHQFQQQQQQQQQPFFLGQPHASTSTTIPPLPPPDFTSQAGVKGDTAAGGGSGRPSRKARTSAPMGMYDQGEDDEDGEDSEDGFEEGDEYFQEDVGDDDMVYGPSGGGGGGGGGGSNNLGAGGSSTSLQDASGFASGSVSPTSGKSGKPRGRKPKSNFGTGLPKDSNEYQKLRKENHKNVEKKRRETINDGIKRLALLVPGADKNKSKIINQAADYIEELRRNETSNIEKWTLDKLMTEKNIRDLQTEFDNMAREVERRDLQIAELRRMLGEVGMPRQQMQ